MLELLEHFTIEQTVLFVSCLALAIKGVIDFCDWVKQKNKNKYDSQYKKQHKDEEIIENQKKIEKEYQELRNDYNTVEEKINDLSDAIMKNLKIINKAMMHDIKQWIIEKHNFYMKQGWIKISELDMIEHRYKDYVNLGGNSTIPTLMAELRILPKHKND